MIYSLVGQQQTTAPLRWLRHFTKVAGFYDPLARGVPTRKTKKLITLSELTSQLFPTATRLTDIQ